MFLWLRPTRKMPVPTCVECEGDHIRLCDKGILLESLRWDRVTAVYGYKEDLVAVDLICLAFEPREGEAWLVVHEQLIGYALLVEEMQRRCTRYDAGWLRKVAFPPFETNLTRIWRRECERSDEVC